jgi:methylmalonyl-CoA mutase cobalamin-binding domain/chain
MDHVDWTIIRDHFLSDLLAGESDEACSLARNALSEGIDPIEFFERCITPSLEEIGKRFEDLTIFLPEMIEAAEIVEIINQEILQPYIEALRKDSSVKDQSGQFGTVLLATVKGDLHDIGKNMVALMLKVNRFDVVDMGIDVAPSDIVKRAVKENVDIIGLSSLLSTCLPYMKDVVDYLEMQGLRTKFPVIIGGAATTPMLMDQIGVNAYGRSAADAVSICKQIIAKKT